MILISIIQTPGGVTSFLISFVLCCVGRGRAHSVVWRAGPPRLGRRYPHRPTPSITKTPSEAVSCGPLTLGDRSGRRTTGRALQIVEGSLREEQV